MSSGRTYTLLYQKLAFQNTASTMHLHMIYIYWVTLCFAKTEVLNSSFKPKLNLDTKIQFQTNAQFDFGFKPSFKLGLKPSLKLGLKRSFKLGLKPSLNPSFISTAILKKLT